MKPYYKIATAFIICCLVLAPRYLQAESKSETAQANVGKTTITFLTGSAFLVKEDLTKIRSLARGERLNPGDRVHTDKGSRIELRLPDKSYVRFDEFTTYVIVSADFDEKEERRNINVNIILGKIWARVSKLFKKKGRFAISTHTAVAGVRGTTYRMNVNQDRSAMVKVYLGEVDVGSKRAEDVTGQNDQTTLEGPHPIPGPYPVSMQQWTYIVSSMQQINIRPDGTPMQPFNFSPEADLNDWVRWNKERDEAIAGSEL